MSESQPKQKEARITRSPAEWDLETLLQRVADFLVDVVRETGTTLPLARIRHQVEQDVSYQEMIQMWPRWTEAERLQAWRRIPELAERAIQDVLPTCVRCGECCLGGSPTLMLEDLEILQSGKIPWEMLVTLRRGEPVRSAFEDKPAILVDERIKIREKPGSRECALYDETTRECTVYADRPMQCRAQTCWDPTQTKLLENELYLARRDIFKDLELLLDLIAEHDRRCGFEKLTAAFLRLAQNEGATLEEVRELVALEDHFRTFLGEKLQIPADNLELVFGRSFSDMVPLFGFRVRMEPDGTRCLVQEGAGEAS